MNFQLNTYTYVQVYMYICGIIYENPKCNCSAIYVTGRINNIFAISFRLPRISNGILPRSWKMHENNYLQTQKRIIQNSIDFTGQVDDTVISAGERIGDSM